MQERSDDRGQVIIVAALVIATTFVGLALVLNSGIYAENLSSRETTDTEGALSFTLATNETIAEAYERTNDNDSATADEARETFDATVDSWESAQQRRAATQGIGVEVDRTAHVGWRLNQSADRSFTSSSGADDWTVAEGVSDVAAFQMDVKQDDLYDADADADWANVNSSFHVAVSGAGDWDLYVFQNSTHIIVHEGKPGGYASSSDLDSANTCAVDTSRAVVDFRAEKLGASDCEVLNFSDDVSSAVDVSYVNATNGGEQVNGTYALVVNGSAAVPTDGSGYPQNLNSSTGQSPTATAVVYSATYTSHYGQSDLAYGRSGTYAVREETYAS